MGSHAEEMQEYQSKLDVAKEEIEKLNSLRSADKSLLEEVGNCNQEIQKYATALEEKVNKLEFEMENINTLNFEQLNEIKSRLQNKLNKILDAEELLIDNVYKCVACIDNRWNIAFVDGCDHRAL